jgi:hypothetical protein
VGYRESDRSASDHGLPSVDVGDASTVLVLGSPMDSLTLEVGLSLATRHGVADTRVVWVTMLNTADEVVDIWDDSLPRPDRLRVVLVGEGLSSTNTFADQALEVDTVGDPGDLTTLGIRLLDAFSAWEDDDVAIHLRLDSLTPLLQYVAPRSLAQFLHILTGRLAAADATAHFHLDPMAHDSRTVHALSSICDAQVTVDGDGLSVTGR